MSIFYCKGLLVSHPTTKVEDHPLSGIPDCPATWGRVIPQWQGCIKSGWSNQGGRDVPDM